jgi:hypothetical protein
MDSNDKWQALCDFAKHGARFPDGRVRVPSHADLFEPWDIVTRPAVKTAPKRSRHPDGLLDAIEAAARLSITTEQVLALVKSGALRGVNIGEGKKRPRYRFAESDLADFISARSALEHHKCPSISKKVRPSTRSTSSSKVVGFLDRLAERRSEKRDK